MDRNQLSTTDEFFEMFGIATRRELIELRECLATEMVAAFHAHDVVQATAIEALFNRIENRLGGAEQSGLWMATRPAESTSVN